MASGKLKTMKTKKIIILGAGAVGSVYGALLSRENEVTLIGNKAHVRTIQTKGLDLIGEKNQNFRLKAELKIDEIAPNTLVLLTTKAEDSIHAIEQMKPILRNDTVIIVLQNGLGNEKAVKKAVGEVEVLRGVTEIAAEFLAPGRVHFWKGKTTIAQSKSANEIAETFATSSLETCISENITNDVWNKLILNCILNPLTALFRIRNNEVASESLKWIRHKIIRECLTIGKAEGIDLKLDLATIDNKISSYRNLSSMCQDIIKGKKTEIEFLNGKLVELGQKHGISTPVNQTLTSLVKFLEEQIVEV